MVREYKGAFSGEHGDGLVRSEWVAWQFGPRLTRAFAEIKALFDPRGLMNPGKIVDPPRMDDRTLFRFPPGHRTLPVAPALDWSAWNVQNDPVDRDADRARAPAAIRRSGFAKAAEMCNNNGHCRKFDAGTMCPSFRVTRDEMHLTRGRANTLRLALSGQFGDGLRVRAGARGARPVRELQGMPARMSDRRRHGADEDRVPAPVAEGARPHAQGARSIADLPRWAPWAARLPWLANLRNRWPWLARLGEREIGFSARRKLAGLALRHVRLVATCRRRRCDEADVVLFVDTFTHYFEPENARAALRVLGAAGYRVAVAQATRTGGRCAAGARISPRASSTRRARKRGA